MTDSTKPEDWPRIFFTYDDWKENRMPFSLFLADSSSPKCECEPTNRRCRIETPFCHEDRPACFYTEEGIYKVHCLPEVERVKIEAEKRQIWGSLTDSFFNALKVAFDEIFQKSLEKETLIDGHLKNLDTLFRAMDFETPKGQQEASNGITELWIMARLPLRHGFLDKDLNIFRLAQNRGEALKNGFYRFHQDLIVKGGIGGYWRNMGIHSLEKEKNDPEMATILVVLYRLQSFLKNLKNGVQGLSQRALALHVFYRKSKGELGDLGGKPLKEIDAHFADSAGLSRERFRQLRAAMDKKDKRLQTSNLADIEAAIETLTNFPKALAYAKDELAVLKGRV